MTRSQPSARDIIQRLAAIKIEDETDYVAPPAIDLTDLDDDQEGPDAIRSITPSETHNAGGLPFGYIIVGSTKLRGEKVTPGDSLQFDDGSFLHNIRIFKEPSTGLIILDGNRLVRKRHLVLDNMLSRDKVNELCLILRAPAVGMDARMEDCRVTQPLSAAVRKRNIIFTNQQFPAHSVYEYPYYHTDSMPEIRKFAQLVCRWRFTEETTNAGSKVTAGSLMVLSEAECDGIACASEVCISNAFLDKKRKAIQTPDTPHTHDEAVRADEQKFEDLIDEEEFLSRKRSYGTIDLTSDSDNDGDVVVVKRKITDTIQRISSTGASVSVQKTKTTTEKRTRLMPTVFSTSKFSPGLGGESSSTPQRKPQGSHTRFGFGDLGHARVVKDLYTFGDLCTGAGGMASGARQAGLRVNFLLDHWKPACETLRLNFKNMHTNILLKTIHDFCTEKWSAAYFEKVDALHISFPCQPHSPVHTVEGKNDSDNIATAYSVGEILEKCMPRVVTFEQTSGIVTHRGGTHFSSLIRQITDAGYSVRWKICNLADYGNVQPRKRLIIIAACPGEILPQFPEPTHGPGLLPFVTIDDVLRKIRHIAVPQHLKYFTTKDGQPYDSRKPMHGCITCDGGPSNLHPNGKRTFTLFELAALQGFLPTHQFADTDVGTNVTDIKRQIGNAVPSMFAKKLFEHINLSLQKSDRRRAAWKPETVDLSDD
jgi:DNA (cytosine-5)-methyltransferase 1